MNPALEKIAKHLRNAEDFARSKRYSEALLEVDYIFQIDPKNYQGRTLQERIRSLQKKEEEAARNPVVAPLSKEGVFRHLRIAEEHFLANRFDEALIETERVLQADPDNYQGRSLLDRIHTMQKRAETVSQARTFTKNLTLEKKIELISQYLREADRLIQLQQYDRALEQVAKVFGLDPTNHFAQAYSQSIEMLMKKGATPIPAPVTPAVKKPAAVPVPVPAPAAPVAAPAPPPAPVPPPRPHVPPVAAPSAPAHPAPAHVPAQPPKPAPQPAKPVPAEASRKLEGRLKMYREILDEMWFDGILTEKEAAELVKIRDMFNISDEEHARLEKEIKTEAYVQALRIVLHDGVVSENEERVLELMRRRYGISMEEHKDAEAKILEARHSPPSLGTILIVDDEKTILLTYSAILRRHGYTVLIAESVEAALVILEKQTPDLILSDVMFPSPKEGGFEFYNQVRNNRRFDGVPFLLMSGVSDEYVVRAGMRLGVDGYLLKPFDNEMLLATLEGKLKR
ncbi:MAG TPA: response regulator [Bacteroidota bacterium]|nr:response regulator [Bacteroidota bacterium]